MEKFFCFGKNDFCDIIRCDIDCLHFDGSGGEHREVNQTNAERIRSTTDEDLAGFLMKLMGHAQCFAEGIFPYHPCPQNQNCKQCGIEWLQQPAESTWQECCPDQDERKENENV